MFEFHSDTTRYFNIQYEVTKAYILPFVLPHLDQNKPLKVLEIGCGEAGVLKAFLERGDRCTGIELGQNRIDVGKERLSDYIANGQLDFICENIYNIDPGTLPSRFDLIILKDVIEHIPDQGKFIPFLKDFLAPGGKVFFAFPPWQMPFGGHQQMCRNRILSKLPYFHLLPTPLYKQILKWGGESEIAVKELLEIKETGISIERFEQLVQKAQFSIIRKRFYLTNPIYEWKFGLKTREQYSMIWRSPGIRNFFSTAAYYLIG